ncbi:MAG: hypothetical protein ACQETM_09865, partial [Bacteroidota bacterium]
VTGLRSWPFHLFINFLRFSDSHFRVRMKMLLADYTHLYRKRLLWSDYLIRKSPGRPSGSVTLKYHKTVKNSAFISVGNTFFLTEICKLFVPAYDGILFLKH